MIHFPLKRKLEAIADPLPGLLIANDIAEAAHRDPKVLITQTGDYCVYLMTAQQAPNALQEIGRLREITFREIGEGSGKSVDLDEFDTYYHHLILWDRNKECIAGAYRMGMGPEIFPEFGIRGFYLRSLFKIKKEGRYLFEQGLELGRAFIVTEYQMRPMPLFLMWKAIIHIIIRQPELRYILGSVSISNRFSRTSRSLIVSYIKKYYFDAEYADYVRPKKEFKPKLNTVASDVLLGSSPKDLKRIDRMISQLEPDGIRFPVLLKKYLTQNARVVGFNVDPLFGNSLDGFMYINTSHLPEETLKPVMDELAQEVKD